jgi:cytochrome c-type biogenesis protein CcmF
MNFNPQIFCVIIFLFFVLATVLSLVAFRLSEEATKRILAAANGAVQAAATLAVISLGFLIWKFISDDFSIAAVAQYSESNLSLGYKISAVWAGAAGSLFIWSVMVFVLIAVWANRAKDTPFDLSTLAVGSAVCAGFAAFLVFVARPFALSPVTPEQGAGLNPLLLNFWMVIHPPLLFLGYSGFLIPFALIVSAAFTGSLGEADFQRSLRRWLLFAFCFLTLGIATGAKWAYVVLGWGGFWGWDPVENASLLPWLAALAALHSLAAARRTNRYRIWTVALVGLPFLLCLVATFITRSGVLQSVHAFGENPMGTALLILLGFASGLWLVAIITVCVGAAETVEAKTGSLTDSLLLITTLVLIFTAAAVAAGTFWPVLSRIFGGASLTPTRIFYDRISAVAGVSLAVLVCFAALINWQRDARIWCLGAVLSHLGFILLVVSAGVDHAYEKTAEMHLAKGGTQKMQGYEFTYTMFRHLESKTKVGVGPEILLRKENVKAKLWPHRDIYGNEQPITEVAVHSGLLEDVYIIFDGLDESNKVILAVLFKPMMTWLWFAMLLIILGAASMWFD